ncbi:hypothetical protein Mpsy_0598 [Methanolobus psychrophilus R15]|nr:hypothetical protein Mpsy_0598 [Methanolobus psychrophilus R15]
MKLAIILGTRPEIIKTSPVNSGNLIKKFILSDLRVDRVRS